MTTQSLRFAVGQMRVEQTGQNCTPSRPELDRELNGCLFFLRSYLQNTEKTDVNEKEPRVRSSFTLTKTT